MCVAVEKSQCRPPAGQSYHNEERDPTLKRSILLPVHCVYRALDRLWDFLIYAHGFGPTLIMPTLSWLIEIGNWQDGIILEKDTFAN